MKIQLKYEDGSTEEFPHDETFGDPSSYALWMLEQRYPDEAKSGQIYFDGDCWYIESQVEATWHGEEL